MTSQLVKFKAFFHRATLNLKKVPVNQLIKKFWPLQYIENIVMGTSAYQVVIGLIIIYHNWYLLCFIDIVLSY